MVERIMLFKLVDGASRAEVAATSKRALAALPGMLELSVGLPADAPSEKSWDVSLIMRFPDVATLERAVTSQLFADYLASMTGRYAVMKTWSFTQLE